MKNFVTWFFWLLIWIYCHYHTTERFESGTHLGYRLVYTHTMGTWMGDYDMQDMVYRNAHPQK